jgi:FAD/FMN-containing dehydrogenase
MTTVPALLDDTVRELRAQVRGSVIGPADNGYDAARTGWNLVASPRPALIVIADDTDDVVIAVRFAAAHRLPVAVRATGHGPGPAADDALLIVTSRLTGVTIDPVARTARIRAGAKWGAVLGPAQQHGLAPLLGSTTDVGAVGYTLGGGMGWLARKHGLACDSVRSIDLVTPDGVETRTSPQVNPELFWALTGAGAGTFGVVTEIEIELYPVDTVYAGNLFYPVELARDVLRRWRDWIVGMDENLTSAVTVINFPPLPVVPEPLQGRSFVLVRGAWSGLNIDRGRELIDQWRAWREPEIDRFGPMPFSNADAISMDPVDPLPSLLSSECFDTLHDNAIDIVVDAVVPVPGRPPMLLLAEFRHAGGAIRKKAAGAVAARGRSGEVVLSMAGVPMDPQAFQVVEAHQRATRQRLETYVSGAAYLNFLDSDERRTRAGQAFAESDLERLSRVKIAMDPDNRFRFSFGIACGGAR